MSNYFNGTKEHPYHLSVGAVVLNDRNEVFCHYFTSTELYGGCYKNLYLLMRETLEVGETLETAVHRGLLEECGVEAIIETYIGAVTSEFPRGSIQVKKTTLYFLCNLVKFDASLRDMSDPEAGSEIKFLPIDFLISKMSTQHDLYKRSDLDEVSILESTKKYKNI
ncbi:MAG: NUDIX domain-containing protein [Patescibacteria group bacterium]|jgi:hypothetical protein